MEPLLPETRHIANGHSDAASLKQALGIPSRQILVHEGWLSNVRIPCDRSIAAWRSQRDEFRGPISEEDKPPPDWDDALLNNLDKLQSSDRITLWLGSNLENHLLLAWSLQLLRALDIEISRLAVVDCCVRPGQVHCGPFFLDPEELRALPPGVPLTSKQVEELDEVWGLFTASDPLALSEFAKAQSAGNQRLRPALKEFFLRYPAVCSGLNFWEERLLYYAANKSNKTVSNIVGYAMAHRLDCPDYVGDYYLCKRVLRLADTASPDPYLRISGPTAYQLSGSEPYRHVGMRAKVKLTEEGLYALHNGGNFAKLNGIDEWIGGVHLDSGSGSVWFRDGDNMKKVEL